MSLTRNKKIFYTVIILIFVFFWLLLSGFLLYRYWQSFTLAQKLKQNLTNTSAQRINLKTTDLEKLDAFFGKIQETISNNSLSNLKNPFIKTDSITSSTTTAISD